MFSGVFRRYKMGTLATNGLKLRWSATRWNNKREKMFVKAFLWYLKLTDCACSVQIIANPTYSVMTSSSDATFFFCRSYMTFTQKSTINPKRFVIKLKMKSLSLIRRFSPGCTTGSRKKVNI